MNCVFTYPFSVPIWGAVRSWCRIQRSMTTLQAACKRLKLEARRTTWPSKCHGLDFACTVYYIWLTWNQVYFNGVTLDPSLLEDRIKTQWYMISFFCPLVS